MEMKNNTSTFLVCKITGTPLIFPVKWNKKGGGVMESLERLNKLISYIEENLDGEIDNKTLSCLAACPLAVIQRLFVLLTGATVTEYVRLRRLARAADDVRSSKEKVIDIAINMAMIHPIRFVWRSNEDTV